MRYDDASQAGSVASGPNAHPDVDALAPGSFGPASGNAITGAGTTSGQAGADQISSAPAAIVEVQGSGGQTVQANGAFQAAGQYGLLSMNHDGDFTYVRNPGTPDGVRDVFNYTLADAAGATSSTTLTIDIGQIAAAAAAQGVVTLPAGVEMSDIHVNGRDLVINMPDGTQMVIPGGAVFVPQLVIGDVEVPPTNLAALLIDSEPQPAAGPPQSSGGNFANPVPPLDPGVPLGDLIPPTELSYTPPEFNEVNQFEDTKPTVIIETPDNPAGAIDASESVNEKGLPGRNGGEPAGSGEVADGNSSNNSDGSETNTGTILFTAQDGLDSVTIDGADGVSNPVTITAASVGTTIQGQYGVLTITGVNFATGEITYSYTLGDNTSGDTTADHFTIIVTDRDGDTATGTLTVDIIDDVPTARNDTDSLDDNNHATGNVMTGAGTTSGAPGADTVGADNAHLTGVSGHDGSDTSFDASGNLLVHGTFGTLTIDTNGNYTYVLDEGSHGGGNDVFTYTLTDGDGDTSQATLTINVPAQNEPPAAADSSVNVSEEGLVPNGIPDGNGTPDTTDSPTASGNINASDPDGDPLTVTLQAPSGSFTSGGDTVHWALSPDGHTLTGYTGGDPAANHVVVVTIDNTGHYEVDLVQPFDDPNTSIEDSISLVIPVNVSDGDSNIGVHITVVVEDDSPVVSVSQEPRIPDAVIDESPVPPGGDGIASATIDVSGAFGGVHYGADGPGSAVFSLQLNGGGEGGVSSGMYALDATDTTSGDGDGIGQGAEIMLVQNADGSISGVANGTTYFNITIDGTTGEVTFTQVNNVWHADTGNNDDTSTLNAPEGSLQVQLTVTDFDGDHDAASVDLSQGVFHIQDDGPSAGNGEGSAPALTIDESAVPPGGDGVHSATGDFSVLFNTVDFGTDGPGNVAYALAVTAGSEGGSVGSGLYALDSSDTTAGDGDGIGQGDEIMLVEQPDGSVSGIANGTTYFTISIDSSGHVTFTDTNNIWHSNTGDIDDSASLVTDGGTLSIVQTVTDADGDSTTASADVSQGVFNIQDDGPTASVPSTENLPTLVVDESPVPPGGDGIVSATADFSGNFGTVHYGTDGPGTVTYGLNLSADGAASGLYTLGAGGAQGDPILLHEQPDGSIIGEAGGTTYFTISVDADGKVTFTDVNNVWHADTASNDDSSSLSAAEGTISLVQTVTDADGDHASSSIDLSDGVFGIQDDGPTANVPSTSELPTLVVDESPVPPGGDGIVSATADFSGNFGTVHYGTDGAGSVAYALNLSVDGAASGLYTLGVGGAQGDPILLHEQPDGSIIGEAGGTTYFTISVDADGKVTFTDVNNVWHADTASNDDSSSLSAAEGTISLSQTVTDADGDHVSSSIDLSDGIFQIQDDGPNAGTGEGETPTLTVDESPIPPGGDGIHSASGDFSVLFNLPAGFGTDGPGSVDYSLAVTPGSPGGSVGSGLYALDASDTSIGDGDGLGQGDEIMLVAQPDGSVSGIANGVTYFTISIDSSGHVTFTDVDNIWHANTGDNDDSASLVADGGTLSIVQTVTDADGDSATATADVSQGVFSIQDDGPTANVPSTSELPALVVDESPIPPNGDGILSATANFAGNFGTVHYGTDGAGSVAYALNLSADGTASGLYTLGAGGAQGDPILLHEQPDGSITGEANGTTYFTISVDSSGAVTFAQSENVYHSNTGSDDDTSFLSAAEGTITLSQTVTDADGDHVSASIDLSDDIFQIQDDGPNAGNAGPPPTLTLDESAVPPGGDGIHSASAGFSVLFASPVDYGTDGPGSVGYAFAVNPSSPGGSVGSGMFALDPTDTTAGDGDGIGKGAEIMLVLNPDGTVSGVANGMTYFTMSVDSSANVTFTEFKNIWHPNTGDNDDSASLNAHDGTLNLVQTVTDADGDQSAASANLSSGVFSIQDDGPTVTNSTVGPRNVAVDETGPLGPGAPAAIALTDGVHSYAAGNDEDVAGSGRIAVGVSTDGPLASPTINFGTDGPLGGSVAAGTSYALQIAAGGASGVTTTEGEAIKLIQLDNGTVLGVVQGSGEHAGTVAFAISINASTSAIRVDQYLSLDHPVNPNPNDPLHLQAGSLNVVVTGTDADGDHASGSAVDITGRITFSDDGPTLGAFSEETIPNDVGSVSGTYAFNWGADGLGGLTVTGPPIAGVTYTTTADGNGGVTLHAWSGATELFNLDVHPDGTYDFNLVTPDAGSTVSHTLIGIASGQNEFIQTADGTVEFTPLNHLGVDTGTVNSSGAGFGNGNQFTGNGEAVTFEFHSANDAGNTDANTHPSFVSQVTLDVPSNGFNGSHETITWYATNTVTHETATGTIQVDSGTSQLVFDPGFDFNMLTIEGSNADGNGIRMTQITTTTTILPQSADYTFQVSATDGDGDPTGTSNVLIHVDASSSSALMAASSLSAMSFDRVSTSSLVTSNDNHESRQAGYTAALMGAVAAVGLEGVQHGSPHLGVDQGSDRGLDSAPVHSQLVAAPSGAGEAAPRDGHVDAAKSHADADRAPDHSGRADSDQAKGADLDHGAVRVVAELLHGTAGSAHGGGANADTAHIAAQSVMMPSAEQLAAVSALAPQASVAGGPAHNEVVAKVLADALHGGSGGAQNIDALVEAAAGPTGSDHGTHLPASHGLEGVSNGHMDAFAGFSAGHGVHMIDAMIVHQDAAPAHG